MMKKLKYLTSAEWSAMFIWKMFEWRPWKSSHLCWCATTVQYSKTGGDFVPVRNISNKVMVHNSGMHYGVICFLLYLFNFISLSATFWHHVEECSIHFWIFFNNGFGWSFLICSNLNRSPTWINSILRHCSLRTLTQCCEPSGQLLLRPRGDGTLWSLHHQGEAFRGGCHHGHQHLGQGPLSIGIEANY